MHGQKNIKLEYNFTLYFSSCTVNVILAEQQTNTQKLLTLTHFKPSSKYLGLRNHLQYDYLQCYQKISRNELKQNAEPKELIFTKTYFYIYVQV